MVHPEREALAKDPGEARCAKGTFAYFLWWFWCITSFRRTMLFTANTARIANVTSRIF